ncbi:MAG TPA: hypothetical protein VF516_38255 [Kofleriaceae bacterium]
MVLVLVLCGACDRPCAADHLPDAPGAGPGEVRRGFVMVSNELDLAATSDGVACLSCDTIFYFDGALREQRRVAAALAGSGKLAAGNAAVIGEQTYVLDFDRGKDPDHGDDFYRAPNYQLFALSSSGEELWRNDLGDGEAWTGDLAPLGPIGPHRASVSIAAGPGGVALHGEPLGSLFDTQGRIVWTTPTDGYDAVVPDASYGLFVAGHGPNTAAGDPQAELRRLGSEGNLVWTATWSTTHTPPIVAGGEIVFTGAARTASGGFLVAGLFSTATLDTGGRILQGPNDPLPGDDFANFVAAIDNQGVTQWAYPVGGRKVNDGYVNLLQVAAVGDGAVICGDYGGSNALGLPSPGTTIKAFVAHVQASGQIAAYPIQGTGELHCAGLATAPDGSAIVAVQSSHDPGPGTLSIGSQTFSADAQDEFFVLNIAL